VAGTCFAPSQHPADPRHLTASEYDRLSEDDMETMHERLEELCEEYLTGAEVEYSVSDLATQHPREDGPPADRSPE